MQNNIFNKTINSAFMYRTIWLLFVCLILSSCIQEEVLTFSTRSDVHDDNARIEINIPYAEGNSQLSNSINKTISDHISNMLNFSEEDLDTLTLDQSISRFDEEFKSFKNDIEESALVWEAIFDAEVIYQSADVICIAINGYMNTGGAHGSMNITLYNFDGENGKILEPKELISDLDKFTDFVKPYFVQALNEKDESIEEYFFGDPFHLPA